MSDERTVFVVEDDQAAAASLTALMVSVGLKVLTFKSAEEFTAAYHGSSYGCLLLDVRLPGMNGLELQESLAAEGWEIPVIFVGGHTDQKLSEKAISNGAVAFFEKPYDGCELCEIVRNVLA